MSIAYQCGSCNVPLYLSEKSFFEPRCPQCRSSARIRELELPETITHFACKNCDFTFGMDAGKTPHTCPKCNGFRFIKTEDFAWEWQDASSETSDSEEVASAKASISGKALEPIKDIRKENEQREAQASQVVPGKSDALLYYFVAFLVAAGIGYILSGLEGAALGFGVVLLGVGIFEVVPSFRDATLIYSVALSVGTVSGYMLGELKGGGIGFGVAFVSVLIVDRLFGS